MSLRMNLCGWHFQAFKEVLGSNDRSILDAATSVFAESQSDESCLANGKAWLRVLIEKGYPFGSEREPRPEPADGGLLIMEMETETHAFVVYSIAKAIAREDHLDLALESSNWKHPAALGLYQELVACQFAQSRDQIIELHSWFSRLSEGSPLFGDDFRTTWSYYTVYSNLELAGMIPVFKAAMDFEKPLPGRLSETFMKAAFKTQLSDNAKEFIKDLANWFGQIQQAGQDAFILWW